MLSDTKKDTRGTSVAAEKYLFKVVNDNGSFSLLNVLLNMSSAASKDTSTMAIDFLQLSVLLMLKSFTQ